jgi:hypothetical protein
MRNKYIYGYKNDTLNKEIIEKCCLLEYMSRYRILDHFYHTDTYIDERRARIQGYIYPKDLYNETGSEINIPESEVSYMDDELILYITVSYPLKE